MTKYYLKNDLILQSIVLDSDTASSSIEYTIDGTPIKETVETSKLFDTIQDLLIALSIGVA